jgi:ketosteroid isomerase-like protein
MVWMLAMVVGCSRSTPESSGDLARGIDSLNARIVKAYRDRDAHAYAILYTDTAVFEWPKFNTVRGPQGLEEMARDSWKPLDNLDLKLIVSSRRVSENHATEFGAFEESWDDPKARRMTEFGRYVEYLARQSDGSWRIDRFFGFEDSTTSTLPSTNRTP